MNEEIVLSPLKKKTTFNYPQKPSVKSKLEPNPDADKYKNEFGGRIEAVERKLALFRNARSSCICCRVSSALHRLQQRLYLQ